MDSNRPVLKRTIMIVLDLENNRLIQRLRKNYDPLADKVAPHITLVFPFESRMSKFEVEKNIHLSLKGITPFSIIVQGLEQQDFWLYLKVIEGGEALSNMHQRLYDGKFKQYKPSWLKEYCPHVTVGHFASVLEAKKAYEEELDFAGEFQGSVRKVTVEIIGKDEKSIIESEYELEV